MDDGSKPSARDAFRSQVVELRSRYDQPIKDHDALLDLLLGPLDLLGLVPESLNSKISSHAHWIRLHLGPALHAEAIKHYRWIVDVQLALLQRILPDWQERLTQDGLLEVLIQQWFVPVKETAQDDAVGAVLSCSLATFTDLLTSRYANKPEASTRPKLRPETWTLMEKALFGFVQRASIAEMVLHCQTQGSQAHVELAWSDIVRHLLSLPDRIANAYEGKTPDKLAPSGIRSLVGSQVCLLVQDAGLGDQVAQPIAFSSILLSRLLRAGWFQDMTQWRENSLSVWPAILRQLPNKIEDGQVSSRYQQAWKQCVRQLSQSDQVSLLLSVVKSLDQHALKAQKISSLLNRNEISRAGAEGTTFLSVHTWHEALQIASVLDLFVVSSNDDDEESGRTNLVAILCGASNDSSCRAWSPLMTRTLVHLLLREDPSLITLDTVLRHAVKIWMQQAKSASWDEEVCLTTLLVLLIAALPSSSPTITSLSTSPDFILGVSKHLEHLSPSVRRLGMLVAEVVSERAGKALSFGTRAWDGRGEGREEARVLRAAAISFPSRDMEVNLSKDDLLSAMSLQEAQSEVAVVPSKIVVRKRTAPTSRTLPERKPAPTRRAMVQEIDAEVGSHGSSAAEKTPALPSLLNISSTQPRVSIVALSDDEQSSSSESDSSEDDAEAAKDPTDDLTGEDKAFGMGTPTKKKKNQQPPIYVAELAPLLRQNEFDSIRMALRHAEPLISRKAGWGGEVNENAVDVCLALCALQNNFSIASFDQRRLAALTALVVASPVRVAPCLAEQYFVHQYSMAQRIAMLNALAFGAAQLATGTKDNSPISGGKKAIASAYNGNVLAQEFAQLAMTRARAEGEERMPEIKREQALMVNTPSTTLNGPKANRKQNNVGQLRNGYLAVAASNFIFPLVNRLWAHLQDNNTVTRRSRYLGSGRSIIDMPFLMGALLDTLAVLCHYAQHEPHFRDEIVPEVVQLVLTLSRVHLTQAAATMQGISSSETDDGNDDGGGSRSTVLGAGASLILVLLDAAWQLDFGASLARQHATLLLEVQHWASAIFEVAQGGATDRSVGATDRSGRVSAAILLRINEVHEQRHERRN